MSNNALLPEQVVSAIQRGCVWGLAFSASFMAGLATGKITSVIMIYNGHRRDNACMLAFLTGPNIFLYSFMGTLEWIKARDNISRKQWHPEAHMISATVSVVVIFAIAMLFGKDIFARM